MREKFGNYCAPILSPETRPAYFQNIHSNRTKVCRKVHLPVVKPSGGTGGRGKTLVTTNGCEGTQNAAVTVLDVLRVCIDNAFSSAKLSSESFMHPRYKRLSNARAQKCIFSAAPTLKKVVCGKREPKARAEKILSYCGSFSPKKRP